MDHIAVLRKARISKGDNLLADILSGKKTIESRWYVNKIAPWNKISAGDTVYLKESGCPVTAVCTVQKVLQFENLDQEMIKEIIAKYGRKIAPHTNSEDFIDWTNRQKNKRYCILIFIKDAARIEPFEIDKAGFGISSAWLCVEKVENVLANN